MNECALSSSVFEAFRGVVYINWNRAARFGAHNDLFILALFSHSLRVTSRRCVTLTDRRMYERTYERTGGRTRARACRKRERRAAHGETRVLPSRCTPVALISSGGGGDGGGGSGGGSGGGDGGGGDAAAAAATNLRAFRHRRAGVARKGVEGAFPTLSRASRGVSRGVGRGQVEEAVADLSINGRLGPSSYCRIPISFCVRLQHSCIYHTMYRIIAKYL